MKYLIIKKTRYGYAIRAEIDGKQFPQYHYIGHTKRAAIRLYRHDNKLTYKHFIILDI